MDLAWAGPPAAPCLGWFGTWRVVTAAVVVLVFRLGFRLACCCRGACCRPWWLSLPAWAVPGRRAGVLTSVLTLGGSGLPDAAASGSS